MGKAGEPGHNRVMSSMWGEQGEAEIWGRLAGRGDI